MIHGQTQPIEEQCPPELRGSSSVQAKDIADAKDSDHVQRAAADGVKGVAALCHTSIAYNALSGLTMT